MQVLRVSRVRSSLYSGFPRVLRWVQNPVPLPWCLHTASADLKELPSADLHGLLLFRHCHVPFTFACCVCREWEYFSLRKGPQRSRIGSISLHPEGFVTEYHNVGVCVLIWLIEVKKTQQKEIENVTNITGVRQLSYGGVMIYNTHG